MSIARNRLMHFTCGVRVHMYFILLCAHTKHTHTHTQIVTVLRPLLQNENLMDRCQSFIRSQDGSDLEAMPPLVPSTALPHMFPGLRDRPTLMRATGQFGSQVSHVHVCLRRQIELQEYICTMCKPSYMLMYYSETCLRQPPVGQF